MTKFFTKPQVIPEHFTNINNTNYTNNLTTTNDINFTLCVTKTSEEDITPAGASGIASRDIPASQPGEVICSGVGNPPEVLPHLWRGLKIDLFDNGVKGSGKRSLKLKLGVIKKDGTTQSLVALMNSPVSYVWRQVEDVDRYNPHWTTVRNIQERFDSNNIPYRVSKCTLPNKGGSTQAVVFLSEDDKDWFVVIVREGQQFNYILSKQGAVTQAQRAGNVIATKFIGQQMRPLITFKELGI
jgi:hypothetical protein